MPLRYVAVLCAMLLAAIAPAQGISVAPKYEMRAVWLTTNWGLDWPSAPARNSREAARQQRELSGMLDVLQYLGFNTVFFQARIRGEVFYPSAYEPWSSIVSGKTGRSPGYDPLAFAVEECHRRGMECHAWLVTIPAGSVGQVRRRGRMSLPAKHPEMCKRLKGNWYLDPGHPATARYVAGLVAEIVSRYDVDGIHLDYIRYPDEEGRFPDDDTYRRHAPAGVSRSRWHADNISRIVQAVHDTIAAHDAGVMLSAAPLGRYTSLAGHKPAHWVCTGGAAQDAVAWVQEGKTQFLVPMMYYEGENYFPYLADWVARTGGQPCIVAGLGAYRLERTEGNWDIAEIDRQIAASRHYGAAGQAFFRARHVLRFPALALLLAGNYYRYPALVPPMTSLPADMPAAANLTLGEGLLCDTLSWEQVPGASCYAVYASVTDSIDTGDALYLVGRVSEAHCTLPAARYRTFAVTAIDSLRREGAAAFVRKPLRRAPCLSPVRATRSQVRRKQVAR